LIVVDTKRLEEFAYKFVEWRDSNEPISKIAESNGITA
jgi:hypothetical protein